MPDIISSPEVKAAKEHAIKLLEEAIKKEQVLYETSGKTTDTTEKAKIEEERATVISEVKRQEKTLGDFGMTEDDLAEIRANAREELMESQRSQQP